MAENTIIHEISLAGYKATSTGGMLDLGTWGSYGIEKLHLTLDAAWQDLTITAFFNVNGKVVAKRVVGKDGYADVPWEATKENTFSGCLAFEGSINGQRRISTNLNYKVTNHSETTDSDPVPTDDRWNQFVTETKEYRDGAFEAAERANARAEDAETASEDAQAAARAAKASENAAAASASNAAADAAKAGPYAYDINDYDAINSKGICSHLETPNQDVWGGRNAGIGFATVGSSRYFMFSMMTSSLPDISAGHEVASLKAYLAAQNDAGTPVQIAYKLAEPIPFTATGAQPLPALAGVNTVLTDADSATVTGRADPIKRTTDLEDAVASQT